MWRTLSLFILVLIGTGCAVQPMTPTPVDVTAPPVAVAVATFTPVLVRTLLPTESATGFATATAIPSAAPGPIESALVALTESAVVALVVNPTSIPALTDVPLAAVSLPPTDTPIPPVAIAPPPSGEVAAAEQYTVDLINVQRAAAGVPLLLRDETLMGIARARVADMVARGYTGHDDPVTGEHLARSMMRAAGYTSSYLGENWYGSLYSPPGIVDTAMAWFMTDAPHANNILSPNFVGVGVGIAFNGQQWLLVQDFAGPNP